MARRSLLITLSILLVVMVLTPRVMSEGPQIITVAQGESDRAILAQMPILGLADIAAPHPSSNLPVFVFDASTIASPEDIAKLPAFAGPMNLPSYPNGLVLFSNGWYGRQIQMAIKDMGLDLTDAQVVALEAVAVARNINTRYLATIALLKQTPSLFQTLDEWTNWLYLESARVHASLGPFEAGQLVFITFNDGSTIAVDPNELDAASLTLLTSLSAGMTMSETRQAINAFDTLYSTYFGDPHLDESLPAAMTPFLFKPYQVNLNGRGYYDHTYPSRDYGGSPNVPGMLDYLGRTNTNYDTHDGDDFWLPLNSTILAPVSGSVLSTSSDYILIGYPGNYEIYIGHLSQLNAVGPSVTRGEVIGASGQANGVPHIHFEVRHNGKQVDTMGWYGGGQDPCPAGPPPTPGGYRGCETSVWLWADEAPPSGTNVGVDVSLIIDSSGSMSSNDPSGMRKEGAKVFVDTAHNGDGIAVVDFATTAFARWPMTPLTNDRTAVKAAIDQIPSNGSSTNIGGGLQVGYDQLQAGNADHQKAAVLMTDGQHNAGTNPSAVVPLYQAAGWPVYTIGLGSGVNQQMLQQIADATGGSYTHLSDPNDLIRVYFEIVGAILGGTTIANQQNLIQQGETVQATVAVPANQSQVTFLVNWPGSRVDTTLTTPSGQQITPQTVDPNVYHAQGLTYELYRITNPESGDWIVIMYGADLPPGGEMVELTVNAIGPTAVAPTANAGGPYSGLVGQRVLFDGSASFDPDGSITLYEWDFDNDGVFDVSASDPTATHVYSAPYDGAVTLRVTDNGGSTATDTASVIIEPALVCNDPPEGFESGVPATGWTVVNHVAGGPEWTTLSACGPYPNWTNGTGDAACVSAGNITVQPFDTELRTPVFDLTGYADAYLYYRTNYQNWASQDQLDLDISEDGGATWTTWRTWQYNLGAAYGLPGEDVYVNLTPYAGMSNLMLRWRYYAPSGQGLGYYAQLDDVRLNCTEIPPTAVTISEMTSATSQSPIPAASLPLAGLPAAAGLAFVAAAWLRRKR